jgi:hypothetical protein
MIRDTLTDRTALVPALRRGSTHAVTATLPAHPHTAQVRGAWRRGGRGRANNFTPTPTLLLGIIRGTACVDILSTQIQ